MTRNPLDAYAAAHAEGLTNQQIADRLGVTNGTVRVNLSLLGLKANSRVGADLEKTLKLHSQGYTTAQIAEITGVPHATAYIRLRRLQLKANDTPPKEPREHIERDNDTRRERRLRERAKLLRTAFMHEVCPVPEDVLGRVMAHMIRVEVR